MAKGKPPMSDADFAKNLRGFCAELDDIDKDLEALQEKRKDVKRRAKALGFKVRYLVAVHDLTKQDPEKRDLADSIMAQYRRAMGIEHKTDLLTAPPEAA